MLHNYRPILTDQGTMILPPNPSQVHPFRSPPSNQKIHNSIKCFLLLNLDIVDLRDSFTLLLMDYSQKIVESSSFLIYTLQLVYLSTFSCFCKFALYAVVQTRYSGFFSKNLRVPILKVLLYNFMNFGI